MRNDECGIMNDERGGELGNGTVDDSAFIIPHSSFEEWGQAPFPTCECATVE